MAFMLKSKRTYFLIKVCKILQTWCANRNDCICTLKNSILFHLLQNINIVGKNEAKNFQRFGVFDVTESSEWSKQSSRAFGASPTAELSISWSNSSCLFWECTQHTAKTIKVTPGKAAKNTIKAPSWAIWFAARATSVKFLQFRMVMKLGLQKSGGST